MKRFISFLFTMVFATGVLFAGASTLSVDAKSSDLQVNSVPETVTENYQKYLDKKEALIEAGWQLSAEHLNADADIYWMEGLTPEGIYFRCFPYAEEEEDACAQVLASSTSSDYYSDLDTYWMDEDTYAYVVSLGTNPYGYAQKKTFVDGEVVTKWMKYVCYKES